MANVGVVIGAIVGVVALILVIICLFCLCRRRLRSNRPQCMTKAKPSAFRRSMCRLRDRFWGRQGAAAPDPADTPSPVQVRRPRAQLRVIQQRISTFFGSARDNTDHDVYENDPGTAAAPDVAVRREHVTMATSDSHPPREGARGAGDPGKKRYTIDLSHSNEGHDGAATASQTGTRPANTPVNLRSVVPIQKPKETTSTIDYYTTVPDTQPEYHEIPQTHTEYAVVPDVPGQIDGRHSLSTLDRNRAREVLENCASDSDSDIDDPDYVNGEEFSLDTEICAPAEGVLNHSYVNQRDSFYHYVNAAMLDEQQASECVNTATVDETRASERVNPAKPYVTVDDATKMGILGQRLSDEDEPETGANLNNAYVSAGDVGHNLDHLPVALKDSLESADGASRQEIKSIMPP